MGPHQGGWDMYSLKTGVPPWEELPGDLPGFGWTACPGGGGARPASLTPNKRLL